MKLSLGVNSYHRLFVNGDMNIYQFIDKARYHQIPFIEPCDLSISETNEEELINLKVYLKDKKIKISSIAIRNDFSMNDAKSRQKNIQHVKKWISIASYLEVPLVRVWAGDKGKTDSAKKQIIDSFKLLVDFSKEKKVTMALENHRGITSNPDTVKEIIEAVNSPYLVICADFGHFPTGFLVEGMVKLSPYIKHVHAKSHDFKEDNEEKTIDYSKMFTVLKEINYHEMVVIEYEGNENHDLGILKTKKLIEKYWEG